MSIFIRYEGVICLLMSGNWEINCFWDCIDSILVVSKLNCREWCGDIGDLVWLSEDLRVGLYWIPDCWVCGLLNSSDWLSWSVMVHCFKSILDLLATEFYVLVFWASMSLCWDFNLDWNDSPLSLWCLNSPFWECLMLCWNDWLFLSKKLGSDDKSYSIEFETFEIMDCFRDLTTVVFMFLLYFNASWFSMIERAVLALILSNFSTCLFSSLNDSNDEESDYVSRGNYWCWQIIFDSFDDDSYLEICSVWLRDGWSIKESFFLAFACWYCLGDGFCRVGFVGLCCRLTWGLTWLSHSISMLTSFLFVVFLGDFGMYGSQFFSYFDWTLTKMLSYEIGSSARLTCWLTLVIEFYF